MGPTAEELDGYERAKVYGDRTVVRIHVRRTTDPSYPSGWRYTFHYRALSAESETLDDGTIRRYDNSHEDTKGHERHVAPDPEPEAIDFPGSRTSTSSSGTKYPNRGSVHPATGETHDRRHH